jgi:hypothetical protein
LWHKRRSRVRAPSVTLLINTPFESSIHRYRTSTHFSEYVFPAARWTLLVITENDPMFIARTMKESRV